MITDPIIVARSHREGQEVFGTLRNAGLAVANRHVTIAVMGEYDDWENARFLRGRHGADVVLSHAISCPRDGFVWDVGAVARMYSWSYRFGLMEVSRPSSEKPKKKYGSEAVDEITRLIDEALETGRSPDFKPINTYVETKTCVDNDGNVRVSDERYDMDTELMAPVQGPPVPAQESVGMDALRDIGAMVDRSRWEPSQRLDYQWYRRAMDSLIHGELWVSSRQAPGSILDLSAET